MTTRNDHRHRASLDTALVYIADLYTTDALWEYVKTVDGIRISGRSAVPLPNRVQDKSSPSAAAFLLPTFRGDGVIQNATVQEVASVLRGFGARKLWDPRFETGSLLETLSDTANLVLSSQIGNLIVRSRDFLTANVYQLSNTADEAMIVSTSVIDALSKPEGIFGKYVRADAKAIGWVLKQNGPDVNVTYIVEVDAKGFIPSSLIRLIQVQAPLCIKRVADTLAKHGALPYIIRGLSQLSPSRRLKITSEWVEPETHFFKAKIMIPTGKCDFSIAFPSTGKYAHGASIKTNAHSLVGTATLTVRQVTSREQMQDIVSEAAQCVLQFKAVNFGASVNEVSLTVRPTQPPRLSAARLSALMGVTLFDVKPTVPVFEVDGEPVVEALISPVDSAVDIVEKVKVVETIQPPSVPVPATYVGSIYTSRVPLIVDNLLGVMDTCVETAVQKTASLAVSSYLTATTLLYGTPTSKPKAPEPLSSSESEPVPSEETTLESPKVPAEQTPEEPLKDARPEPPASPVDSAIEFNENQTPSTDADSAVELNENQTPITTTPTEPTSLPRRVITRVKSVYKSHAPRLVHGTLDIVDSCLETTTKTSVSVIEKSYRSAATMLFGAPKPKNTTETSSDEQKAAAPSATKITSIYKSYPPRLVHSTLDVVNTCLETATKMSVSVLETSYRSAATLMFGSQSHTHKSQPKTPEEQQADDQLYNLILEQVL
ncbi:hypothetical protein HDU81_003005 [Chytriomyces hyalinus]|nr:hypothetical protein HDU81_003005 [Chytriomyces hyalinus]